MLEKHKLFSFVLLLVIQMPIDSGFQHLSESRNTKWTQEQMVRDILKRRRSRNGENPSPAFPNGWIPILDSNKLKVGQVVAITVLGEDLTVFRGTDGKAYVVDSYCPHLGANLGVGGKVRDGNCIQCPFHGWTFNGESGSCTAIPYSEKIPQSAKIRSWTTCEKTGFVFIWYHAEGESPSYEIPDIENIANGKWSEKGTIENFANVHIQIGPALSQISIKGLGFEMGMIMFLTPEAPYQIRITQKLFSSRINFIGNLVLITDFFQLERDIIIWNNKRYASSPLLLKEDGPISKFRRFYSQFYSENSKTVKEYMDQQLYW